MLFDHMVSQDLDLFGFTSMMKIFKGAEADMTAGQPNQHGGLLGGFPVDGFVTGGDAQCPGSGNAQTVHGFTAQVFADGRAQYGATIAKAGVGRLSGAFEMDVPFALWSLHFTQ